MPKILSHTKKNDLIITVRISGDTAIKQLNKKYRNKDYATDVLSFEINDTQDDGSLYVGDVIVNLEQAKRQAKEYDNDTEHEVAELAAHGILHLLGVHHEGDDH